MPVGVNGVRSSRSYLREKRGRDIEQEIRERRKVIEIRVK